MNFQKSSLVPAALAVGLLAGCSSAPDYNDVPVSKLPAGTAPKGPPPPPPGGATASGTPPRYSETGSPAAGSPPAGSAPSMPAPPPLPNR